MIDRRSSNPAGRRPLLRPALAVAAATALASLPIVAGAATPAGAQDGLRFALSPVHAAPGQNFQVASIDACPPPDGIDSPMVNLTVHRPPHAGITSSEQASFPVLPDGTWSGTIHGVDFAGAVEVDAVCTDESPVGTVYATYVPDVATVGAGARATCSWDATGGLDREATPICACRRRRPPAGCPSPSAALNPATGAGAWLASADGGVTTAGNAPFLGSAAALRSPRPSSAIAATPAAVATGWRRRAARCSPSATPCFSAPPPLPPERADRRHGGDRRRCRATGWWRRMAGSSPLVTRPFSGLPAGCRSTGRWSGWRRRRRDRVLVGGFGRWRVHLRRCPLRRLDRAVTPEHRSSAMAATPTGHGYWLVAPTGACSPSATPRSSGPTRRAVAPTIPAFARRAAGGGVRCHPHPVLIPTGRPC